MDKTKPYVNTPKRLPIRHLLELSKNGAVNVAEWQKLRLLNSKELEITGIMAFSHEDWKRQAMRVTSLELEQRLRLQTLLARQSDELLNHTKPAK